MPRSISTSSGRLDFTPIFTPEWSSPTGLSIELDSFELQNSGLETGKPGEKHIDSENEPDGFEEVEQANSFVGRHEHLLKSGPLGRCDDPFCTTCPAYFEYSRNLADFRKTTKSESFFGEAKAAVLGLSKWRPGIFNPHTKVVQRWNQLFAVCCLFAVFVDPLFFFIFSSNEAHKCIQFDQKFATTVTIFRSIFDGVYFVHMLLQFRLAYFAPASRTSRTGALIDDPKTIALHYLKGWFLVDLLAVLPIPQVFFWAIVRRQLSRRSGNANYLKNLLRVVVLLQYVPRMFRFVPLLIGRSQNGFIFETAWASFTINLFLYLLAGHVVGSCWYLFGLQRVNQCLQDTCNSEKTTFNCTNSFLDCGNGESLYDRTNALGNWINQSDAEKCFNAQDDSFDYGIYETAVPVTLAKYHPAHKYIYSIFWGFLQISTLAGNLKPSLFVGEVLFTMAIIGLGLLLFALLIGNMQNFLQSLGRRRLDMQLRRRDVESWMKRRYLPTEVQRRVRQAVRLKWASTRGVNEEELLDRLPEDLQKEIRRFLCFDLVKQVRIFTVMDDQVLDAICERLHEMLYIEGSEVFRTDGPLHCMVFIVRGTLESVGKDGSKHTLVSGDFCGEELLIWSLEHTVRASKDQAGRNTTTSIGHRAVSTRTVRCLTSVEAFCLEQKDLQYVTTHYTRYMRNPRVQGAIRYESPYFRSLAATRIQAGWISYRRRKMARALGGNFIDL